MPEKKRKYILFNDVDGRPDHLKPCAFFSTPEGCRSGASCKFSHGQTVADEVEEKVVAKEASKEKKDTGKRAFEVKIEKVETKKSEGDSGKKRRKEREMVDTSVGAREVAKPKAVVATKSVTKEENSFEVMMLQQKLQFEAMMKEQQEKYERELQLSKQSQAPAPQQSQSRPVATKQASNEGTVNKHSASKEQKQKKNKDTSSAEKSTKASKSNPTPTSSLPAVGFFSPPMALPTSASSSVAPRRHSFGSPDDDTKFLFNAVNTALIGGNVHSTNFSAEKVLAAPTFGPQTDAVDRLTYASSSQRVGSNHAPVAPTYPMGMGMQWNLPLPPQAMTAGGSLPSSLSVPPIHTGAILPPSAMLAMANMSTGGGAGGSIGEVTTGHTGTGNAPGGARLHISKARPSPFVNPSEVMKVLSTSGTEHATLSPAVARKTKDQQSSSFSSSSSTPPLPLTWEALVLKTREHPRYARDYALEMDASWIQARPWGDWCTANGTSLPPVMAIDCEMCQTADPLTGEKDSSALLRVSIVDGMNPSKVLLDTLVLPTWPVVDMRSGIHGITDEQLRGVHFTLRHIQAILASLCCDRTILVGHGVNNDLRALRFNHGLVVDTAYLYTLEGEPLSCPSLRDVSERFLGVKLGEMHDSVRDAQASLYAAHFVLKKGVQLPFPRSGLQRNSLLVHRVPNHCSDQDIFNMVLVQAHVVPMTVSHVTKGGAELDSPVGKNGANSGGMGKTTIVFKTQQHADLAFETIPGPNRPDKGKRGQKRVYLKGGGYICIRKQTADVEEGEA